MKLLKNNFRIWWQKPKKVTERDIDREITQLELFYDLVYVALIIQLTHVVAWHVSGESIIHYLSIFFMMLWAWFNGSMYHELHGNNDMKTRILTFLQMIFLAWMWIFIHSAFNWWHQGFAIFYTLFLTLLTFLWWRTGVHDPEHKPISTPYVMIFLVSTFSFFISIFTKPEISYTIWWLTIIFSIASSILYAFFPIKNTKKEQIEATRVIWESFVERIWLLTIIILWEWIISIVWGSTHIENWDISHVFQILGCFIILIWIWWIFFDFISRRLPNQNNNCRHIWMFLHFPLLASLWLINAWILNSVKYSETLFGADRWIITFPLIVFLLCVIWLEKVIKYKKEMKPLYKKWSKMMFFSIIFLLIISFLPIWKTLTIWLIATILLLPIYSSFMVWLKWKESEK